MYSRVFYRKAIQTEGTFPEEEISDVETSHSCNTLDHIDQVHYTQTVLVYVKMIFLYLYIYLKFVE